MPDFERVGDLLRRVPEASDALGADARGRSIDTARLLAQVWPEVVGPEVAANAKPVQLRQGRLVVAASSSAWAQTLQLMSEAIVTRLNERLGPGAVDRAVFRHAGWDERPARIPEPGAMEPREAGLPSAGQAGTLGRLTKEQEAALAAIDALDLSPGLREKMKRAIKAAFVYGEQDSVR